MYISKHFTLVLSGVFLFFSCTVASITDGENISTDEPDVPEEGDKNYYADYVDPLTPDIKAIDLGLSIRW